MSTISASTTSTTAYKVTADTTGTLVLQTGSTPTTAVTIDGSQNVGVGVAPSAWSTLTASQVKNASVAGYINNAYFNANCYYDGTNWRYISNATNGTAHRLDVGNGAFAFNTAPSGAAGAVATFTQAMTLDASGNLLVGTTTSQSSRFTAVTADSGSTSNGIYLSNASAQKLFQIRGDGLIYTGGAANSPYNLTTASAANMYVDSGGLVYRSTSSLKYKTSVQDATHGLAEVMALRSVIYKGKNDGDTVFGGLIAEEVHAAGLTEFVQYAEDGTPDALAYGNMVSLCIKAIQEQQALITQLQADVAALKG